MATTESYPRLDFGKFISLPLSVVIYETFVHRGQKIRLLKFKKCYYSGIKSQLKTRLLQHIMICNLFIYDNKRNILNFRMCRCKIKLCENTRER